jgi:hypothetical protein
MFALPTRRETAVAVRLIKAAGSGDTAIFDAVNPAPHNPESVTESK